MMAADENFQAHIKLMKMAVVRRAAPDCNNLCDCGPAERLTARWGCGGSRAAGGGVAGWRTKPAGLMVVCELWSKHDFR